MINWHTLARRSIYQTPLRNYYDHKFHNHMSFGSSKGTHCLNPMRYHGAYIENTCCHQPPSIVTQSIWIYDYFRVSPMGQNLLLILAQAQYPLKVKNPYNIVTWWIMTIDSLELWFTIGPIQCVSHTLIHSPLETYPDGQDKSSLQLGGGALQFLLDCLNPWTNCKQIIYLQGIHDLYLLCNS